MNPFNKLPLLTKRMNEIISLESITLDKEHDNGDTDWTVVAEIADMVQVRPAIYHPADRAEPEEYGPAICSAVFQLTADSELPPLHDTEHDQIEFLHSLGLDWDMIEYD